MTSYVLCYETPKHEVCYLKRKSTTDNPLCAKHFNSAQGAKAWWKHHKTEFAFIDKISLIAIDYNLRLIKEENHND